MINTSTNQVVGSHITVGTNPYGIAITPNGQFAYVTNIGSNDVSVINTANSSVSTFTIGSPSFGIAITPNGQIAYITDNINNQIFAINTSNNQPIGQSPIPLSDTGNSIAITADGQFAYVTLINSSSVAVIDLSSNQQIGSITVGSTPQGIAISSVADFAARPSSRYITINKVLQGLGGYSSQNNPILSPALDDR